MFILEILFCLFLFIVIYSYVGYGILITVINKIPFLKILFPKPKNSYLNKKDKLVTENLSYPTVTLIISASGETKELIREKILNTNSLDYPKEKLEVIFAVAFDSDSETDETVNEYYEHFLEEVEIKGVTSKDEEIYVKFLPFENSSDKSRSELIEEFSETLSENEFSSADITINSKLKLDKINKEVNTEQSDLRVSITKDVRRKGKISQVNRTVNIATGEILVFSDANSMFNSDAIKNLVKHFSDISVGCVAGEKRVKSNDKSTSGDGEGLYWKYESYLKKQDSDLYTACGAAGEIFAIRKSLWEQGVPQNAIIEDFVLSMKLVEKGYRIIYEPNAYAEEEPSLNMESEFKRRVRIAAGGFQAIVWLKKLLNPFYYRVVTFEYVSHRVLRWAIVPFLLPIIFLLNIVLSFINPIFYTYILIIQILFYMCSFIGYLLESKKIKIKVFYLPYVLTLMNVAAVFGFFRFIKGEQTVIWEKVKRI
ncbi:MAG TPA: glycosyltransferase family 2 protein [Ignavibacteria bacterium]|nr:glycosyltransferase family 2 protein [Ignavibacteria bacterium]